MPPSEPLPGPCDAWALGRQIHYLGGKNPSPRQRCCDGDLALLRQIEDKAG